jgi:hypothetical protein
MTRERRLMCFKTRLKARTLACALLLTLAVFGAMVCEARAATDFCPAQVSDLRPTISSTADNTYRYNLFALTPSHVHFNFART